MWQEYRTAQLTRAAAVLANLMFKKEDEDDAG
jgi:hypothetical protein